MPRWWAPRGSLFPLTAEKPAWKETVVPDTSPTKTCSIERKGHESSSLERQKTFRSNSASVAQHPRRCCGSTPLRPANAGWEGGFPPPGCVGHLTLSPQPPTTLVWRQRKTVKELGVSPLLGGNIQWPQHPWRPHWGQWWDIPTPPSWGGIGRGPLGAGTPALPGVNKDHCLQVRAGLLSPLGSHREAGPLTSFPRWTSVRGSYCKQAQERPQTS